MMKRKGSSSYCELSQYDIYAYIYYKIINNYMT